MTIAEILSYKEYKTLNSIDHFVYRLSQGRFGIRSSIDFCFDFDSIPDNKVSLKEIYYHNFDGIRYLGVFLVCFEDKPCALYFTAGRDGDDDKNYFIFDKTLFLSVVSYLESFSSYNNIETVDINEDLSDLDFIYGQDMGKILFDKTFNTTLKVGDFVSTPTNLIKGWNFDEEYVKAKIISVDQKSSINTYKISLIDFRKLLFIKRHETTRKIFKKFDVLNFSDFAGGYDSWDELSDEQKEITLSYLSKLEEPTFFIPFKEEIKLSLIN